MADDKNLLKKLDSLYSSINAEGCTLFDSGRCVPDPFLNAPRENDKRRGITLLVPLDVKTAGACTVLENDIRAIEPDLYFYPVSDLHVTVLDLVSVRDGFRRDDDGIGKFIRLMEKAVAEVHPFSISFKGIITSRAGILVKGYYSRELQDLRARIRELAIAENIALEERYKSYSAHVTVARFKSLVRNWPALWAFIEKESLREVGAMTVNAMHLVIHDWYNREKETIGAYCLR